MSEKSTGNIVRYTFDPANPPRLTASDEARLNDLQDDEIDLSDVKEQSGRPVWQPARYPDGGAAVRRAAIQDGLLLVDQDVVQYFKESGNDFAKRMNAVLREYAEAHQKSA